MGFNWSKLGLTYKNVKRFTVKGDKYFVFEITIL